jgi:hypothetical protein
MLKSWKEVKKYLLKEIERAGKSEFTVVKDAGLTRDSYYKIFAFDRWERPMRKATVYGFGRALGYRVRYQAGIPQFSIIGKNESGENVTSKYFAREALKSAIRLAGSIDELARLTSIEKDLFNEILSDSNDDSDVSTSVFVKIASELHAGLLIHRSGEIFIKKAGFDVTAQDALDEGLEDLIANKQNRAIHSISDIEAELMLEIYRKLGTQATIDQWISVLYSLRGLEKVEVPDD